MNGLTDRQTDMVNVIEEFVQLRECDGSFGPFFTLWSIMCNFWWCLYFFATVYVSTVEGGSA
jgi:hypothetical protein